LISVWPNISLTDHAQRVAAPGEHGVTDRLAGAHHGAQTQPVAGARLGHGLHHGLQRGGEQEAVRHAVLLHQLEGRSGVKRPWLGDDRRPKYSVGSSASIRPPVQAQSAGLQNTSSRPPSSAETSSGCRRSR
jgi:hypothetical protein